MKYKLILKTLIILTLFLAVGRVVVANLISTSGVELGRINEEIATVKSQNDSLREELYTKESFVNIASEAARIGFSEGNSSFVLTSPLPFALR